VQGPVIHYALALQFTVFNILTPSFFMATWDNIISGVLYLVFGELVAPNLHRTSQTLKDMDVSIMYLGITHTNTHTHDARVLVAEDGTILTPRHCCDQRNIFQAAQIIFQQEFLRNVSTKNEVNTHEGHGDRVNFPAAGKLLDAEESFLADTTSTSKSQATSSRARRCY
jgi:hypothetical protein